MKKILVSIIILNLNGKDFMRNCLISIKRNTKYKNYKVIVVDNNSQDGSQKIIKSKFKWVDLIENKTNRGFSGGNNDGINYAIKKYNPKYFYLLNNDTIVNKNWLTEAIKTGEKSEKIGIVGSRQLTFEKKPAISAGWIRPFGVKYYFGKIEREVGWVSGAGFLIKKSVFEKIGLFDEAYSPAYYEETDLEKRASDFGFKIFYSPDSVFLHKGGATTKNIDLNFSRIFYRNRYYYFKKSYPAIYFIPRYLIDFYRGFFGGKLKNVFLGYKEGQTLIKHNSIKKINIQSMRK